MKWTFWTRTSSPGADDCETIEPLLSLYADGMASADETRRVETHLPECAVCRASLAWIKATQRALTSRPIMAPSSDLRARIADAIVASSAVPVPGAFNSRPARVFALRPVMAAAASVVVLGVVAVSLRHAPQAAHPPASVVPAPSVVAGLPSDKATSPTFTPPAAIPGAAPHIAHRMTAHRKSVVSNPDLTARVRPDETLPEPIAVKARPAAPRPEERTATALVSAPLKPHVSLVRKTALPRLKPEMMAITPAKHQAAPVETVSPSIIQSETNKPETVVATLPPPVPINVGPASIKQDPAPIVAASSHESRPQKPGQLSLSAYVGHLKSFTHSTLNREASGSASFAMSALDPEKASISFVHGPTH